jgi:hypothetical protein
MADQITLNNEQIAKVRQVLKLNMYYSEEGVEVTSEGNHFTIKSPMTIPVNGVETPIGYISTEGAVFYDLTVENGVIKLKNVKVRIKNVNYRRANNRSITGVPAQYKIRVNGYNNIIYDKSYPPGGGEWTDNLNKDIPINDVDISVKRYELKYSAIDINDSWVYNPTYGQVSFSLTVPDRNILKIPKAPTEGTLVIKYKNDVTGEVLYTTSETVQGNTNHSHTAPEIFKATYKLIGNKTQIRMVPAGDTQEMVFRYNPIYGQTVKYIDKDTGQEIRTKSYTPVTYGDPFRQDPPSIQGYRLVPGQNPINVPRVTGTGDYSFRYEKIPTTANVIVKHLNKANNQPLRDDVTLSNQTIGSNVNYNPPAITNFSPERTTYTHTVVEGNNVITVYYTENAKIRPWAIRKSNTWKSLNTTKQWMKIRRNANQNYWDTKPNAEIYEADTGKENYSPSRIRKGGKWKAQGKIGN